MPSLNAFPKERRAAVRAALSAAFETTSITNLTPIVGGVSGASITRFEMGGRSYVLRLEPERIALEHRQRGFLCMTSAAGIGAAPAVHYANPVAGVAIMDFIASTPLTQYPGGAPALAHALGLLMAHVRETAPFPFLGNYPDVIATLLSGLGRLGLLAPASLDPLRQALDRIQAVLRWDREALVSSHNDPNPRNILFDGVRLWLIDWELASLNDPLVDLAILTNELADTPELEATLLQGYFGAEPSKAVLDRMAAIRLLVRLFYGCIVLDAFGAAPRPHLDPTLISTTPGGFRAAVSDGRLKSGAPETAFAFGLMSLRAFLDGVSTDNFGELLERVEKG